MRAFLRHFLRSLGYLASQPMAWVALLAALYWSALLESPFVWEWLAGARHQTSEALGNAILLSLSLAWCALVAAVLPSVARTSASGREGWPLPALPISARARAVAEVTAALTLLLMARTACLVGNLGLRWRYVFPSWSALLWLALVASVTPSVLTAILGFPLIAAWLGSGRRGLGYWVRVCGTHTILYAGLAAAILTGHLRAALLPRWLGSPAALPSLAASLAPLTPLPLLLSIAVIYSIGRGPSRSGPAAWRLLGGSPHRAPTASRRRLRGDILGRSVPLLGLTLVPGLAFAAVHLGLRAGDAQTPQGPPVAELSGFMLVVAITWCAVAAGSFFPLGLPLLRSGQGLFAGHYRASWSPLPVRPEVVQRVAYAHGLLTALLVAVGLVVSAALVLGRDALPTRDTVAAWTLSAGCWAGGILCVAAGDRLRGCLAVAGVGLSLWWWGGQARDVTAALLVAGAGLAAALPLVHLRRPRRLA